MAAVSPAGPPPTIRQSRGWSIPATAKRLAVRSKPKLRQGQGETMLRLICGLLIALLPVAASAQPASPRIAEAIPAIDRIFGDFQLDSHAPGLVYGIVADGRLVHAKAFGVQDLEARRPVTTESLFRIASMSKAFTALAILKLR